MTLTSRPDEQVERTQQIVDAGAVVAGGCALIEGVDGNDLRAGQEAGRCGCRQQPASRAATAVPCCLPDTGRAASDRRITSTWPPAKAAWSGLIAVSIEADRDRRRRSRPEGRQLPGQSIRPIEAQCGPEQAGRLFGAVIVREVGERLRRGGNDEVARGFKLDIGRDAQAEHFATEAADFGAIKDGEAVGLELRQVAAR